MVCLYRKAAYVVYSHEQCCRPETYKACESALMSAETNAIQMR